MKIIVGLGNPGLEYENTRHNAGFMAVDRLAQRHAPGQRARARFQSLTYEADLPAAGKCLLMKPMTYMNLSGQAVADAVRFYKLDPGADMLVLVDDVALPVGVIRVRERGGAGGHNGLADIALRLGGDGYARCRIGVGDPGGIPQRDYVLGRFSREQWDAAQPALDRAADAAVVWAAQGALAAMNTFNVKARTEPQDTPGVEPGATEND